MKFACPHCSQKFDIPDEWAGHALECPSCKQAFTLPSVAKVSTLEVLPLPQTQLPPLKQPPRTSNRPALSGPPPRKQGVKLLLAVILLAAAGFGYAMVHFKESPQQVWQRLAHAVEGAKPTPSPKPGLEPTVAPELKPTTETTPTPESASTNQLTPIEATSAPAEEKAPVEVPPSPATAATSPTEQTTPTEPAQAEQQKSAPATGMVLLTPPQQRPVNRPVAFPTPRFVHPGVPFTREDLELLKVNIKREPWKSGFEALAADSRSKLDYKMAGPFEEVKRKPNVNLGPWRNDMTAVHNLAVMWWFTGNSAYAQKARDILIAYAKTEKVFGGSEGPLDLGDYVWRYVVGADILRGTWPGWTRADTELVKKLFNDVYWPGLGMDSHIVGPANKGTLAMATGAGIAAFCDDREKLEHVISLMRTSASSGLPNVLPTGGIGETGRDGGHSYHQWASLTFAAEVVWKQGIDVYSEMDNRLLSAGEYYARNTLGLNSPFVVSGTVDAVYWRPTPNPGWPSAPRRAMAILHGAYTVRKKVAAPYLERFRESKPLGAGCDWMYEKSADRSTANPLPPVPFPTTARVTGNLSDDDIGGAKPAGSGNFKNGIWTVTGGGAEVWTHDADSCYFTYKQVTGNCAIIAKLESMEGAGPDARAGVMIRSNLIPTAANRAWLAVKPGHKMEFYQHGWTQLWSGSYREKGNRDFPESEPYWMKIERLGNVISLYLSVDGASWFAASAAEYKLPDTMSIGLMVCSKADGTPTTARFSHVSITGGNGGPALAAPEAPRNLMASPGPKQVPLRWTGSHDAVGYIVKRSTTKGGPYATIAKVAGNSHTDVDVVNDTTYYYVVSAANAVGESPNSPEDAATPKAPMWNVTFGGTATATVAADTADKAFDSNTATRWYAEGSGGAGAVQYDFGIGRAPVIERYTVTSSVDVPGRDPKDWQLQGSNDGTNWTTLDTQSGQTFPFRYYEMEYALARPATYRYFQLNVTANNGANNVLQIADIKLLSNQSILNAPVSPLIHWRANDAADRERAIEARKADEARR